MVRVSASLLIRRARLVPVGGVPAPDHLVDLLIRDGVIVDVTPSSAGIHLAPTTAGSAVPILDADGRWTIPGLWDQHVHMTWWSGARARLDLADADSPSAAAQLVAQHVARRGAARAEPVIGFGYRPATWSHQPEVAVLDAVSGSTPVILSSGDCHAGWLNSAALQMFGLDDRDDPLTEGEWFSVQDQLAAVSASTDDVDALVSEAISDALSRGVVGIVDFEFADAVGAWRSRGSGIGCGGLRVRPSVYPDLLDEIVREGLQTGDRLLADNDLITMGPLKILSDGSLNTRTAHCHSPYADGAELAHPSGVMAYTSTELVDLMRRAEAAGLRVNAHAIGDAALDLVLDAAAASGAAGRIEHAQLADPAAITRMAELGWSASVQPAHLLDDRPVAAQCWPDRMDRCFAFASFRRAGVALEFGSDAPVSRLDPWLAMSAAVYRGDPRSGEAPEQPWNPSESLSPAEVLAASTDGTGTLCVGALGDLVLLDDDPLAPAPSPDAAARRLRAMTVSATVVDGVLVHDAR